MNSIGLKDDLLGLKSKLENLEKEFEGKLQDVEGKERKFREADEQVNEFINTKDSAIKLNIGGKIFQTKISTLLSIKDTLFYKLIMANLEEKKEVDKEIFFDRSFVHFSFILDYLRTKKYSFVGYSRYELEDILYEVEYYGFTEILEKLAEMQKEIEFVRWDGSPQYTTCGTNRCEDLKDKSMLKGICVQAPYIINIELNFEHEVVGMEIAGCNGNPTVWPVGTGANAKVSTSVDKVTWKDVGNIPASYTVVIQKVSLTPSLAKYIRFSHSSHIGIGYLNLLKK